MAICEVCGNDYYLAFQVVTAGRTHTFDSFECAINLLAPVCGHCGCKVIGHGIEAKFQAERLTRRGLTAPPLLDSVREGEALGDVKSRLGEPAEERWSVRTRRVQQRRQNGGTTTGGSRG